MHRLTIAIATSALASFTLLHVASAAEPQWAQVAQALGKSGTEMPGGIYRVGMPRTDLKVSVDDVELKPTFALGSWVAFMPIGQEAMVMGDLVLTEDEI